MLQQLLFYNLYSSAAWVLFMLTRTVQKVACRRFGQGAQPTRLPGALGRRETHADIPTPPHPTCSTAQGQP
jgi:hypothetical protein